MSFHSFAIVFVWTTLLSATFWLELYLHWVAFCSILARFLVPLEEWASDSENCDVKQFRKIHAFVSFLNAYGSLNKRSDLSKLRNGGTNGTSQQAPTAKP